jgi:hypothetical protein
MGQRVVVVLVGMPVRAVFPLAQRVVGVVMRHVRPAPKQRFVPCQPVVELELDSRWEGPGDAFQTIVESMDGLEVRVTPADGSPSFDALLVGG